MKEREKEKEKDKKFLFNGRHGVKTNKKKNKYGWLFGTAYPSRSQNYSRLCGTF
jgi:hypothetical protein